VKRHYRRRKLLKLQSGQCFVKNIKNNYGNKLYTENLKGKHHLGNLGIQWRIILKCNKNNVKMCTVLNCLRIGSNGKLL
jgi:hypothetical protein